MVLSVRAAQTGTRKRGLGWTGLAAWDLLEDRPAGDVVAEVNDHDSRQGLCDCDWGEHAV